MGVSPEGEFHELAQSASEAPVAGVVPTGEIHLESQCASEGLLEGVAPEGEFHETSQYVKRTSPSLGKKGINKSSNA